MTSLHEDRRQFTVLRNKVCDVPVKTRLTTLINNLDILIRDPGDEACWVAYRKSRADLARHMAGRA